MSLWNDYDGAVLSAYGDRIGLAGDALKSHLVNYIRQKMPKFLIASGSVETDIYCWGDYQRAENVKFPTIVITIQKEVETNRYIGNCLFDYTDITSGTYEMVYGGEYEFLVGFDIWATSTTVRDMIDWKLQNLLKYASSPSTNDLYDKGIRGIRVVGSEIIGYDQTDRYIKDVSYHVGVDTIYRRIVYAIITADVRIVPIDDSSVDSLIKTIRYETYYNRSGSATFDVLVGSGVISGSGT